MPQPLFGPNTAVLVQIDVSLIVLLLAAGSYTSITRMRRKVYATPEDYQARGVTPRDGADEAVERARRMHQNHLENVPAFVVLSMLFAATDPNPTTLSWLLWTFLIARVLYSLAYIRAWQPYRTIAFSVGALSMFAMIVLTLLRSS